MTILVTGGAGFIGSHLTERLLQLGHTVICLDNLDDYYDPGLKQQHIQAFTGSPAYHFIKGDIRRQELVADILSGHQCDTVIHLAARAGVRPSVFAPALYVDVNVNGTLSVLEAMRQTGVRRLILASSSSVYGNTPGIPFREDQTGEQPVSPYASSKYAAELLAHAYHSLYHFDISCLRLFTVYGPRQRPEMAISQFVHGLLTQTPIRVFGDGSVVRNYTYIDDTVTGFLQALTHLQGFQRLNIGGAEAISLQQLISLLEQLTGQTTRIQHFPLQPGDVLYTAADLTLAQRRIGYHPAIPLREGLQRFISWHKKKR
ncbi:NAD-dependent epimerase/dehydratase family protein [Arsenicibacter rosenii]|uniref:Epimerase n=1 Tax=Arsenicibacter rosenii TaxID=1750698 RepID=A0A1S2VJ54_9BACT|nr:NAD-dependent epimerase/dehydratase family protein [Arsenicibacter rosenii]OIN58782.1 epimerase [Arsenicibacter rosenii]